MNKKERRQKVVTQPKAGTIEALTYQEEILKASDRIGTTTDQAGSWITRFAGLNLRTLSTGQWVDLQYEVACLSEYQYQAKDSAFLWQHAITKADWDGRNRYEDDHWSLIVCTLSTADISEHEAIDKITLVSKQLPPRDQVETIQGELLAAFHDLERHETVKLQFPSLEVVINVAHETDENIVIGIAEKPQHLFVSNVILFLATNAVRIRRCADCQAWFFADRKNKSYCSLRCQSRAGTRRWRGTPPDKLGQRGRPPMNKNKVLNNAQRRKRHGEKRR